MTKQHPLTKRRLLGPEGRSWNTKNREFEERAAAFRVATESRRNFADCAYRESFAHSHMLEVLENRQQIESRFTAFHNDPEFANYLRVRHPDLHQRATAEMEILVIAARMELAPPDGASRRRPSPFENHASALAQLHKECKEAVRKYPELTDHLDGMLEDLVGNEKGGWR